MTAPCRDAATPTLLRGAELYGPAPMGRQDVLLAGGKVIAVAPELEPNLPELQVVDARGLLALPGLVDLHVHVTGGGGERGFSSRVPELSAGTLLSCGVTSVVGVLGTDSVTRSVKSLLAKTKALREEGLSAWCLTGAYAVESPTVTGDLKDDLCYIAEILGVKIAVSDHRCSMPTTAELARLAANVRLASLTANKPGVVHFHVGRGKQGLGQLFEILEQTDLPIRHLRPTHCENAEADAARFGRMGGYIDFTADEDAALTAEQILRAAETVPPERITMSSDAGGSIPVWNADGDMTGMAVGTPSTLLPVVRELWQRRGMAPEQALSLVTRNPADSLLLPGKGRLTPEADGDLLLTDGGLNPQMVFAGGRLLWQAQP